jgi:hypothetical protein
LGVTRFETGAGVRTVAGKPSASTVDALTDNAATVTIPMRERVLRLITGAALLFTVPNRDEASPVRNDRAKAPWRPSFFSALSRQTRV